MNTAEETVSKQRFLCSTIIICIFLHHDYVHSAYCWICKFSLNVRINVRCLVKTFRNVLCDYRSVVNYIIAFHRVIRRCNFSQNRYQLDK